MKRVVLIAAAIALVWSGASWAAMSNSKHDLSSGSTATIKASDTNEVCIFCHTPHRGSAAAGRPLWNHTLSTAALTWSPTTTIRGTTLPTTQNATGMEGSAACLSCHDGQVALGSVLVYFDTSTNTSGAKTFNVAGGNTSGGKLTNGSGAFIDVANMSKNHPVGVQKPSSKTGFTDFKATDPNTGVWYRENYVACGSCHNPHLTAVAPFLRISNASSAICTSCHDL